MARPSKPVDALEGHRTKQEKAYRKAQEEAGLTGRKMQEPAEVKADKTAHIAFLRTKRLLHAIGKDDELYLAPTVRYCTNTSKLSEAEADVAALKRDLEALRAGHEGMGPAEYYQLLAKLESAVSAKEKFAQSLRKELFDYEKENCMTVAASLRSISKTPPAKTSALKEALSGP